MEITERVAYLKGLAEGMELNTDKREGKLLAAVVDVLEEMAKEVTNIDEDVDTLYDEVDAMSEDLEDVDFTLDRPFAFRLTAPDGTVLFVGIVGDPTQK